MTEKQITIKGLGYASQEPDQIELKLGLYTTEKLYDKAFQKAAAKVEALQAELTQATIPKNQIKTSRFNVSRKTESYRDEKDNYRTRFVGYQVSQDLVVVFPLDMKLLGQIIDGIDKSKAGPDLEIRFTLADPTDFQEKLLQNAAKDARRKAEVLAAAMEKRVGELQKIDYSWGEVRLYSETEFEPRMMMETNAVMAMPDIQPMAVEQTDSALFVWELTDLPNTR